MKKKFSNKKNKKKYLLAIKLGMKLWLELQSKSLLKKKRNTYNSSYDHLTDLKIENKYNKNILIRILKTFKKKMID